MGAPILQRPAPLMASGWMLQVKGIPSASTNADMQSYFSTAISMFHGTPFQFAFLHNDLSQPALNNARLPQQALLHFATLDGARSAQSCLWATAEHFQDEWAWFRTDAETHILERRAHVKQLDQPSQVDSQQVSEAGAVQHQGTMQPLLPVQAAIQEPMTNMSMPASKATTQNGIVADTRPGMQQPNLTGASSQPTSETTVKYCPGLEVSSAKLITEAAQLDLSQAAQASIQPPPPPPLHELAASSETMGDATPPPLPTSEPPPPPPSAPPQPPPAPEPIVPPLSLAPRPAPLPTPPLTIGVPPPPPAAPPPPFAPRYPPHVLQPAITGSAATLDATLPLPFASPSPALQTAIAQKARSETTTGSNLAVTSAPRSSARVPAPMRDGSQVKQQAVTSACTEGHAKETQAAVTILNQQCLGKDQHREEVLHCDLLAAAAPAGSSAACTLVTGAGDNDSGRPSNHLRSNTVDKQVATGYSHQHAAASAETQVPQTVKSSCERDLLQPALQKDADHSLRDKAGIDRDKHKDRLRDSTRPSSARPSSHDASRERHRHHHHHKDHRHDKSSHQHDKSTHRHYEDSSVRDSKRPEQSQNRHSADLSSHVHGHRPSRSSLPSSRAASKDNERHRHSPDIGRPHSGSHHCKRSRSPHDHDHNRWVHQKR